MAAVGVSAESAIKDDEASERKLSVIGKSRSRKIRYGEKNRGWKILRSVCRRAR